MVMHHRCRRRLHRAFDPNGFLQPQPRYGTSVTNHLRSHGDVLVTIDDDFANQILYSAWRSGVLCQTIDASTFPIDTSILNLITGDAFMDLFPETSPLIIQTKPSVLLELNMTTASDARLMSKNSVWTSSQR